MADNLSILEATEAIYARLMAQWEGWKNQDPTPNLTIVADDFNSFCPDGLRYVGRPTIQQMSEQPISGYKLSEFRVVPVGANAALVTYFAEIEAPGHDVLHHMAVGEFWAKRNGEWRISGFSGTLMK